MLITLKELIDKYSLKINGIVHIGAHLCEELKSYNDCGVSNEHILWIEGNPKLVDQIKKENKDIKIVNAIISDKDNEPITLNITNNGQSSSILELGTHARYYPNIKYIEKIESKTKTIPTVYLENGLRLDFANFLNIDIQGAELLALKGMKNLFKYFDYLYLEVNEEELYEECALINNIDDYVKEYGFTRVEIKMTDLKWGDAFYIRDYNI